MDWQSFVDQFDPMTCLISVEKTPSGGYGTIRIVTGNQSYVDSIATAAGGVDMNTKQKKEFIPNSVYTRYIPKDLNFEDVCYRCAILKQPIQNCVHIPRYPFDIIAYLMPMTYEDDGVAYCTYSQVLIPKSEENLLSKNISLETAMDVVRTCVKLRGSKLFHDNMSEVIEDIRNICRADYCCVMLMDARARACSVLGEAKSPDSGLAWMRSYINDEFYDLAESWLDTIGGSYCLVINDRNDMEYIRERNPRWHASLVAAGVDTLVIFPLFYKNNMLGYIWAINFDAKDTERIKDTLELTTIFIASEIANSRVRSGDHAPEGGNGGEEPSVDAPAWRNDGMQKMDHIITGLSVDLSEHLNNLGARANSMITAMASDYRSVYHVDLDKNDGVCYRGDPDDAYQTPEGIHFPYLERFTWYANNIVTENYREDFLNFIEPDNIRAALANQPLITYRYLARRDDHEYYEMIRMAGVRRVEDRDDHTVHSVGLGFTVIDAQVRETMAKNEALAEALSVAEEASRAKTAFLSNMSHEIRTPMNAIIGLDKLALRDPALSAQTREYLEKIGQSSSHLLGLINDILDMSRIESGHLELRREEFSFRDMLEQINLMVTTQCGDKGLTYESRLINRVDDRFIGDDMKLKEVLLNILSNAIKFTNAPGRVTMTVEQTAVYGNQTTLRFRIRDTGIGIDKDYIPRIFDAFSQEDSSRKNKYGSTGLGMAITKAIVEMMNGSIHVESEKGVGTEFTVMITLRNCEPEADGGADESISDPDVSREFQRSARSDDPSLFREKQRAELAGRRVLLAEDIEINAEILMDILSMEDIEADHAKNGRLAVEMFEQSPAGRYSAILMDVRMPEMDGLEAAEAIRALPRDDAKRIPIIALTANAFDEDVQRSMQAGMNSHLSKPVDSDRLFQTLGELIYEAERP